LLLREHQNHFISRSHFPILKRIVCFYLISNYIWLQFAVGGPHQHQLVYSFFVPSVAYEHLKHTRDTKCKHVYTQKNRRIQSWMTIKKTRISAQPEFLKPIYLCLHRIVLISLGVPQNFSINFLMVAFLNGHPYAENAFWYEEASLMGFKLVEGSWMEIRSVSLLFWFISRYVDASPPWQRTGSEFFLTSYDTHNLAFTV